MNTCWVEEIFASPKANLSQDVCVKAMQIGCWSKLFASRRELKSTVLSKHRICNRRDKSIVCIFWCIILKFPSNVYQVLMIGCVNFKIACLQPTRFRINALRMRRFRGTSMKAWRCDFDKHGVGAALSAFHSPKC